MAYRILNAPGAANNPAPFVEQARPDAGDFDAIAGGFAGTGVISGCEATFGGSFSVSVAAGTAVLDGTTFAVADTTLTLATADGTYDRTDLILAQSGSCIASTGTPGAVPSWNSYSGYVLLAIVIVPAAASTIDSTNVLDKRILLASTGLPTWFLTSSTTGSNGAPIDTVVPPTDDVPYLYWDDTTGSGLWITPPSVDGTLWTGLGRIADTVGPGLSFHSEGYSPFLTGREGGVVDFAQTYSGPYVWELNLSGGGVGWAILGGFLNGAFGALRLCSGDPNALGVGGSSSALCIDYGEFSTGIWQFNSDLATPAWEPYGTGAGTTPQNPLFIPLPVDLITNGPLPDFTYDNGTDGVGATCTATVPDALTVDGVEVSLYQRICISTQGDPLGGGYAVYFGIYDVTDPGSGGATPLPWILTRSTDCNTGAVLGSFWTVYSGNEGTVLQQAQCFGYPYPASPPAFVVGTDALDVSVQISAPGVYNEYSLAPVVGATASGVNSVALGAYSTASGASSATVGVGSHAYSGGQIAIASASYHGAFQTSSAVAGTTTSDDTETTLVGVGGYLIQFVDENGVPDWTRTVVATGRVVARRTDTPGTDSAWSFQGICRGNGVSSYSWVGGSPPTMTLIAQDAGASAWSAVVDIHTSGGPSSITAKATGEIGSNIAWECTVDLDEVAG